jgi:type I restriction enzyme R subunit
MTPEQHARQTIDQPLTAAGWAVQDFKAANLQAARGMALREFELNPGHGTADYLLYVDGKAAGIVEAKKQGATLTGVEAQSARHAQAAPGLRPPPPVNCQTIAAQSRITKALVTPRHAKTLN